MIDARRHLLKYGFCKKLLRYKWTSNKLNIFFPLFDWSHSKPIVKKLLGWAVHKGGWRKGSKIDQNLPTNCFRKLLTWEGGGKEDVDVFYGWSLMEVRRNCSPREGSFHFHIQSLISLFSLAASDGRQITIAAGMNSWSNEVLKSHKRFIITKRWR